VTDILITASGISKSYRRLDTTSSRLKAVLSPETISGDSFVALSPMDLTVRRGESLGIVGRNGSGKSTLLSIIAGVLVPSTGSVTVHGRVAALLELGSGFDPEFTGRENAYFNGALHGLSRSEMDRRFDNIKAFAEIGDFIDRPVKTYSSGMFVRLAFSVAVHIDPDILIVDESLSVGDVFFQQKCFDRLREMRRVGTSLLFVSHDSSAIARFCDRALLMEAGHMTFEGDPLDVIRAYESQLIKLRDSVAADATVEAAIVTTEIVTLDASVEYFGTVDAHGEPLLAFVSEEHVVVRTELLFHVDLDDPHCGFKIRNRFGEVVFETNTYCMNKFVGPVRAGDRAVVDFSFDAPLAEGEYTLSLGVASDGYGEGIFHHQLIYSDERAAFSVLRNLDSIQWAGVVNLAPDCTINVSTSVS
jgi:lipopolysaccharide transport system ATP-binding protein